MTSRLRRFSFTTHVTLSVGWLGAVVAYLALAIGALTSRDAQTARAAYLSMELIGWFVIVPFCLTALLSGLIQSLGTEWGLFRHYWILIKFILSAVATVVLLLHMPAVSNMAGVARGASPLGADAGMMRLQLVVHAAGGLLVLLVATVLSVYKPWGRTPYGRRKQHERRQQMRPTGSVPDPARTAGTRWMLYVVLGIIVLILIVMHLAGRIPHGH